MICVAFTVLLPCIFVAGIIDISDASLACHSSGDRRKAAIMLQHGLSSRQRGGVRGQPNAWLENQDLAADSQRHDGTSVALLARRQSADSDLRIVDSNIGSAPWNAGQIEYLDRLSEDLLRTTQALAAANGSMQESPSQDVDMKSFGGLGPDLAQQTADIQGTAAKSYLGTSTTTAPTLDFSIAGKISLAVLAFAVLCPGAFLLCWCCRHEVAEHLDGHTTIVGTCLFCLSSRSYTFWFLAAVFAVIAVAGFIVLFDLGVVMAHVKAYAMYAYIALLLAGLIVLAFVEFFIQAYHNYHAITKNIHSISEKLDGVWDHLKVPHPGHCHGGDHVDAKKRVNSTLQGQSPGVGKGKINRNGTAGCF